MHPIAQSAKTTFQARALLLGEHIDLRALEQVEHLASDPVTVAAGAHGLAVIFRFGAVVLFDVAPLEEGDFLRQLRPLVRRPFEQPELETLRVQIDPEAREGMKGDAVLLHDYAIERFQLVAEVLGKSTVLAMYESMVMHSFQLIEPFAVDLEREAFSSRRARELLRHIGKALLSEHNMVGRVQVADKPDLIWERPDLERLYLRLEDEFEIRDRLAALERKLELVSRTAQTALEVLRDRRSLRVEWYIVILIVIEIMLTLYQMFTGMH